MSRTRASAPASGEGIPLRGAGEPFTSILYFVEASLDRLAAAHAAWRAGLGHAFAASNLDGGLAAWLVSLEPVVLPSAKYLFVETDGPWTAVISQGSDLSWLDLFSALLRSRVVKTSFVPHVVHGSEVRRYGDCAFTINDVARGGPPLHHLRTVQASHQPSGWEWHELGDPQPFEVRGACASRRVRDRFDLPRLNCYCRAMGFGATRRRSMARVPPWSPSTPARGPDHQVPVSPAMNGDAAMRNGEAAARVEIET